MKIARNLMLTAMSCLTIFATQASADTMLAYSQPSCVQSASTALVLIQLDSAGALVCKKISGASGYNANYSFKFGDLCYTADQAQRAGLLRCL